MTIYRVSYYAEGVMKLDKWMIVETNYYSTKRKANNRVDNAVSRLRDEARSVKDVHHDCNAREVTLYMESGYNKKYVISAIEVE